MPWLKTGFYSDCLHDRMNHMRHYLLFLNEIDCNLRSSIEAEADHMASIILVVQLWSPSWLPNVLKACDSLRHASGTSHAGSMEVCKYLICTDLIAINQYFRKRIVPFPATCKTLDCMMLHSEFMFINCGVNKTKDNGDLSLLWCSRLRTPFNKSFSHWFQ